mmetsp:Transcript_40414/g.79666  ORF Transcript_40414/g.79666 Transcript_40414/m.79666 type:complete len:264 (+) Transcript_40414:150-941(+)
MKAHLLRSGALLLLLSTGAASFLLSSSPVSRSQRCRTQPRSLLRMGVSLYGTQGSRSPLVNWCLFELDVPFEQKNPREGNPNPFRQVPFLTDDSDGADVQLFESGAILSYLYDKYGGGSSASPAARSEVNKWLIWANASLDPILFKEDGQGRVFGTGVNQDNKKLRYLDTVLGKQPFVLGDQFSVADVAIAAYLLYMPQFFPSIDVGALYPNVADYMLRCCQRDAYKKAYEREQPTVEALLQKNTQERGQKGQGGEKKFLGLF